MCMNNLTEKLKFELTDRFINFTTGEINAGYTPFTLSECKNIVKDLSYEEAKSLFPSFKDFLIDVEKEIEGSAERRIRLDGLTEHLTKIFVGTSFDIAIQVACDDVDEFSAIKMSETTYDVSIPHRDYDEELGYVQRKVNIGTISQEELIEHLSNSLSFPYFDIYFSNDRIKEDIIEAVKTALKNDRYSHSRDFELYSDILTKKYSERATEISTLMTEYKQKRYLSLMAVAGFKKLWDMYI